MKSELIKEFSKAVTEGYAAIFAGAGLGHASGFPNWKELIRPFAEEISLNVDEEHDLVEVLQYYRNKRGNRTSINQKILNEFSSSNKYNENIDIITRLPIKTYWTTNYDHLIEEGLEKHNRKADVKITIENLSSHVYDRDAVVYKMHGDKEFPKDTVILRDDYEKYRFNRSMFKTALKGDLVSKTFLFIGFSFEDPNLNYILSKLRALLNDNPREHYVFFKKIDFKEDNLTDELKYKQIKQELKIEDLKRFGIQTILVDEYEEVTKILKTIEKNYLLRNIFISGSLSEPTNGWSNEEIDKFCYGLGLRLVNKGYRIVSGFGYNIGSMILNGSLRAIRDSKYKRMEDSLSLWPFPVNTFNDLTYQMKRDYRQEMINGSGVAIFIFGNKIKDGKIIPADGMLDEFELAKANNKIIIPIGSTGGTAFKILEIVKKDISEYPYLEGYLNILENCKDIDELIETIIIIINNEKAY